MKKIALLILAAFCAKADIVTPEGMLDQSDAHVQGFCTDGTNYWMSQKHWIYKVDAKGNFVKKVKVPSHSGDLCFYKGKVYNGVAKGKGLIQVFDTDLNLLKEKEFDKNFDGICVLDGVLYVGATAYMATVPVDKNGKKSSRTPHFDNLIWKLDPETLEFQSEHIINYGHKTHYGTQNIATDGKKLYMVFYAAGKAPNVAVFDKDLKLLEVPEWRARGHGIDFVFTKDGTPILVSGITLGWAGAGKAPTCLFRQKLSFHKLVEGRLLDVTEQEGQKQ